MAGAVTRRRGQLARRARRTRWVRSSTSSTRWAWTSAATATRITVRGAAPGRRRATGRWTSTPRPIPAWPRTSSRPPRCCSPRPRDGAPIHEAIFEDRLEWLADLRTMGACVDIADAHHAAITGPRGCTAPRWRWATCAPARRSILGALAAEGRATIHGVAPRPAWLREHRAQVPRPGRPDRARARGGDPARRHEDRHRPRDRQRPRLRQGQGHRHPRAVGRGRQRETTRSSPWARRPAR